jgi:uncharacterized membrane protein YraQ (UPF0718 family)/copper chaperone CopZ
MELIVQLLRATVMLFADMAPYILLGLAAAGALSVLVSRQFVVRHLGGSGVGNVLKASLFGVPLPLCSCSVVPTASYFRRSGASRPSLVSFLISTPQTGVDSIVATYGMLGPLFAVIRPIAALIAGLVGGISSAILGRHAGDSQSEEIANDHRAQDDQATASSVSELPGKGIRERLKAAWEYSAIEAVDDLAGQFLIGVLIGGAISVLLPADFFLRIGLDSGPLAMLAMIAVGTPMYICATSSIPVAIALIAKGLSPGAAYVFLVAGPATNIATLLILSSVIGKRDTIVFVATILTTSLLFGLAVEWIVDLVGWKPPVVVGSEEHAAGWLQIAGAVVFSALLAASWFRRGRQWLRKRSAGRTQTSVLPAGSVTVLDVQGMTCDHCEQTVEAALRNLDNGLNVLADRSSGTVTVRGEVDRGQALEAIRQAGYDTKERDAAD